MSVSVVEDMTDKWPDHNMQALSKEIAEMWSEKGTEITFPDSFD